MKKLLLLGMILAIGLLGLSSCNQVASRPLEGTWTLTSVEDVTGDSIFELGNGNFTLSYIGEVEFIVTFEVYAGTGNIGGVDYVVQGSYSPDLQQAAISLSDGIEDSDTHYIDLEDFSYSGESTLDGDYYGEGNYSDGFAKDCDEGTFAAAKN